MANNILWNSFKAISTGLVLGWQLNGAIDACRSLVINEAPDYNVTRGPGGTTLKINFPHYTPPPPALHNYAVYDASEGSTPKISVTPGNHYDSSGGTVWVPTLDGNVINVQIGSPLAWPTLTIDPAATVAYFNITVNPLDGSGTLPAGAITAIEIDADTGGGVPVNTNTNVNQAVAYLTVTIDDESGNATVTSNEGGVSASQVYQACLGSALFGTQ